MYQELQALLELENISQSQLAEIEHKWVEINSASHEKAINFLLNSEESFELVLKLLDNSRDNDSALKASILLKYLTPTDVMVSEEYNLHAELFLLKAIQNKNIEVICELFKNGFDPLASNKKSDKSTIEFIIFNHSENLSTQNVVDLMKSIKPEFYQLTDVKNKSIFNLLECWNFKKEAHDFKNIIMLSKFFAYTAGNGDLNFNNIDDQTVTYEKKREILLTKNIQEYCLLDYLTDAQQEKYEELYNYTPLEKQLKLLALGFSLKSTIIDAHGHQVFTEGFEAKHTVKDIIHYLEKYSKLLGGKNNSLTAGTLASNNIISQSISSDTYNNMIKHTIEVYKHALGTQSLNDLLKDHKNNNFPIYIFSGFDQHSTSTLLTKNKLYEFNRGAGRQEFNFGLNIYSQNEGEELIKTIYDLKKGSSDKYIFWTHSLKNRLDHLPFSPQVVGDCAYLSQKGAMVSIAIDYLENNRDTENEYDNVQVAEAFYQNYCKFYCLQAIKELKESFELNNAKVNLAKQRVLPILAEMLLRSYDSLSQQDSLEIKYEILNILQINNAMDKVIDIILTNIICKEATDSLRVQEQINESISLLKLDIREMVKQSTSLNKLKFAIITQDENESLALIKKLDIDSYKDCNGYSLFHYAILNNMPELFKKMISENSLINLLDFRVVGGTPFVTNILGCIMKFGSEELFFDIMNLLKDDKQRKFYLSGIKDGKRRENLLHMAIERESLNIVKYLLEFDDISWHNHNAFECTPLKYAQNKSEENLKNNYDNFNSMEILKLVADHCNK